MEVVGIGGVTACLQTSRYWRGNIAVDIIRIFENFLFHSLLKSHSQQSFAFCVGDTLSYHAFLFHALPREASYDEVRNLIIS